MGITAITNTGDTRIIDTGSFRLVLAGDYMLKPSTAKRVAEMVALARAHMARVMTLTGQSQTEKFKACMGAYFRVPGAIRMGEYNGWVMRLTQKLAILNAGLQSRDLTIHTAIGQHDGMEDAAAYVQRNDTGAVISEALFGANPGKPAGYEGDIFMRLDTLGSATTAAANLIHEASHRYLGTRDWAYLPNYDMLDYEATLVGMDMPLVIPKSRNALKAWYNMSVEEALNNADSYGGFVTYLRPPL